MRLLHHLGKRGRLKCEMLSVLRSSRCQPELNSHWLSVTGDNRSFTQQIWALIREAPHIKWGLIWTRYRMHQQADFYLGYPCSSASLIVLDPESHTLRRVQIIGHTYLDS